MVTGGKPDRTTGTPLSEVFTDGNDIISSYRSEELEWEWMIVQHFSFLATQVYQRKACKPKEKCA